jgi:hypothetical protein
VLFTAPRILIASAAALIALALPSAALAAPPVVSIEDATNVSYTTAETQGEVDPADHDTSYHFEYVTDAQWGEEPDPVGAPGVKAEWLFATQAGFGSLPENAGSTVVPEVPPLQLTGLQPSTTYHLRLVAENSEAERVEDVATNTFTTKGPITAPVVSNVAAEAVSYLSATATGSVDLADSDPGFNATACRFEYLTQAAWQANGNAFPEPEGAPSAPCDTQPAGEGSHQVSAALASLQPGTTYHLRLVAANQGGTGSAEAASTFTTLPVARPTITALTASAITGSSAHLSAEIDPNGTDPVFDTAWHFQCVPACSGNLEGDLAPGTELVEVEADAKGLLPNQPYTLYLYATNAGGTRKATASFSTPGAAPKINPFDAGPLTPTTAGINAEINPNGSATVYWFEWGTEDCSTGTCASLPASHEANAGSSPYFTYVLRTLTGLQPSTTYHFRIVAKNSFGIAEGPDRTFTTPAAEPACTNQGLPGAGFLPDCRAWEMVSPPDKNGVNVTQRTDKTHVSTDGDAVTFGALGNFGDVTGSAIDTEYLARRTAEPGTNGWATHGINPLARGVAGEAVLANTGTYVNAFAPDLDSAIYRSWRPLTGPSNVEDISNLYTIGNLRQGPPQPSQLLSDAVTRVAAPVPPGFGIPPGAFVVNTRPELVGASADLGHVFFEEHLPLTADAQALLPPVNPNQLFSSPCIELAFACEPQLYDSVDGEVRLVGRVPAAGEAECDDAGGQPCLAAPSSSSAIPAYVSGIASYAERSISEDGRRVYFQIPGGSLTPGAVYLREDGERSYKVADSAEVYDTSRDGSRVFFLSPEQLLSSDTDGAPDVYMWDREASPGQRLTLISASLTDDPGYAVSVAGASADGRSVYFVSVGQLIAGQPPAFIGLYRWHDGGLAYIGQFNSAAEVFVIGFRATWRNEVSAKQSLITPDGRHLIFMAGFPGGFVGRGGFDGYDHAGHQELYLYDAGSGRLRCATCNPSGGPAKTDALLKVLRGAAASESTSDSPHALSDDGRYLFFSSGDALVPEDTNGVYDAYEFDSRTGALHLISSGTDPSDSFFVDASDDGSNAFFVTAERLSGWDVDGAYDLYDARRGGGLPEPAPVPAPCAGDSCLPATAPAPGPSAAGSASPGPGNPPWKCSKDKFKKHGKCVKKPPRKRGHKRHANSNRRASK